jgi:hypothetical protein
VYNFVPNTEFTRPITGESRCLDNSWWVNGTGTEAERQELRAGVRSVIWGESYSARILAWSRRLERQTLWALVQRLVSPKKIFVGHTLYIYA